VAARATVVPPVSGPANKQRFEGLASAKVTATRKLFFSEAPIDPTDPESGTNFFITVDGQTPVLFDPNNPPAITTTQGSVEDWTSKSLTRDASFHIHQIHFLWLAENGKPVPKKQQQFLDMKNVPFWKGSGRFRA